MNKEIDLRSDTITRPTEASKNSPIMIGAVPKGK